MLGCCGDERAASAEAKPLFGGKEEEDLPGLSLCTTQYDSSDSPHSLQAKRKGGTNEDPSNEPKHIKERKTKRKVGRPVLYQGDPNSPDLDPGTRRVVLRRIANRDSARRVRAKWQTELDGYAQRAKDLQARNIRLRADAKAAEANEAAAKGEVADLKGHLHVLAHKYAQLQTDMSYIRRLLAGTCEAQRPQNNYMAMQADLACPGPALPCLAILEDPSGMLQQGSLERPNTPAGHIRDQLDLRAFGEEVGDAPMLQQGGPFVLQGDPSVASIALPPLELGFSNFLSDMDWPLCS